MTTPHARTSDIPGWTCPPRVRDIPQHENSWGWVYVGNIPGSTIVQDEQGYLWADGDDTPRSGLSDRLGDPGAILCWTEHGLGVYMRPGAREIFIMHREELESRPQWMPIAVVLPELPAHIMES